MLVFLWFLTSPALAEAPPAEAEGHATTAAVLVQPVPPEPASGFTFLGVVQSRALVSSVVPTSPFLDGQVVGELGGSNGTVASADDRSALVEQRVGGFFGYAPPIWDGRTALNAAFEVDFAWGDQSYGTRGNTGGGFGADQVNLQTRRLNATFQPLVGPRHRLTTVLGLQFVADGVHDPAGARPDDLFRQGGGLRFWGSEAAGLTAFGTLADASGVRGRYRVGAYTLVENASAVRDDVTLVMADVAWHADHRTTAGLHAWHLRDRSGGQGQLGMGPTSALSELQGGPRIQSPGFTDGAAVDADADLVWLGADFGRNHALQAGRVGLTGLVIGNAGRVYFTDLPDVTVQGGLIDVELRARVAPGGGSVARVEVLAVSGAPDSGGAATWRGVVTGNSYGVVGAVYASHGTLLLHPDPQAINRQVSVVGDVSNAGAGLLAANGGVAVDAVPSRLTVAVGGGVAANGALELEGAEVNTRLRWSPRTLLDLELAGAAVLGTQEPATPWIALLNLAWVVF